MTRSHRNMPEAAQPCVRWFHKPASHGQMPRMARLSVYGRVFEAERNTPYAIVQEGGALRFAARTLQESQIQKPPAGW